MFGHEDVAVDVEPVAFPDGFEGLFEEGVVRGEGGLAAVAAEGDEVEVTFLLVSLEAQWHVGSLKHFRCRENSPPYHPTSEAGGDPDLVTMNPCRRWGTRCCGSMETWATRHPVLWLDGDLGHSPPGVVD